MVVAGCEAVLLDVDLLFCIGGCFLSVSCCQAVGDGGGGSWSAVILDVAL